MSSNEIREKINAEFEGAKPTIQNMREYSSRVYALAQEYYKLQLKERFGVDLKVEGAAVVIDLSRSLSSYDKMLDDLEKSGAKISRANFDVNTGKITLYV